MKIVTVTLMRKGSQRLPGKNTMILGTKPLYHWTAEAAFIMGWPYYLFHNYEKDFAYLGIDNEIRYEGDGLTMDRLLDLDADVFIMLPVTSPFRNAPDIKRAVEEFVASDAKIMVPVVRCRQGTYYDESRRQVNVDPFGPLGELANKHEMFRECGTVYAFRREQLHKDSFLSCSHSDRIFYIDPIGIDINTEADWKEAERWLARHTS